MKARAILTVAVLVAGCSTDPWPGTYVGTTVTEGSTCAGEPIEPATRAITVRVERGIAGLFVSGTCLVTLHELSSTSARVRPSSCETVLESGDRVLVTIIEGHAARTGDRLVLEYSARVEDAAGGPGCIEALSTFEGTRD
jgi:hypothetical protein